jgi:hypothetical protein
MLRIRKPSKLLTKKEIDKKRRRFRFLGRADERLVIVWNS